MHNSDGAVLSIFVQHSLGHLGSIARKGVLYVLTLGRWRVSIIQISIRFPWGPLRHAAAGLRLLFLLRTVLPLYTPLDLKQENIFLQGTTVHHLRYASH